MADTALSCHSQHQGLPRSQTLATAEHHSQALVAVGGTPCVLPAAELCTCSCSPPSTPRQPFSTCCAHNTPRASHHQTVCSLLPCRPGDTLWLAPHTRHTAAGVTIPWPLQLLGGGTRPEDTWLTADKVRGWQRQPTGYLSFLTIASHIQLHLEKV
jgi:hypothetical protein